MAASDTVAEVQEIAKAFGQRDDMLKRMYRLLRMDDELEQTDMESFVANDPRTLWNMATYLLIPRPPQFKLVRRDGLEFGREFRVPAQHIAEHFNLEWRRVERAHSRRGRNGFFRNFIGLFLMSGWYAIAHGPGNGIPMVDYWNPLTFFPVWSGNDEIGLSRLARRQRLSYEDAVTRARINNWEKPDSPWSGTFGVRFVTEYDLWKTLDPGQYSHTVVIDNKTVKPWTLHSGQIKVEVGIAGGLPDNNLLDDKYPANLGQAVLATNEKVYGSQNRQHTFLQQMIRDTANPRWFEQGTGDPILRPEDMFKRGAIFRGGINDRITPIAMPPIPIEATAGLFNAHNMLQRGGVSDITFGNIQQQISSILMSQAAESAMQLIDPYKGQIETVMTAVTNGWWHDLVDNPATRPEWFSELPDALFEETDIEATYTVKIPGDLQARALMAKHLNSSFRFGFDMIYDTFFPEVTNKAAARAALRADDALNDPSFYLITVIESHRRKAEEARLAGNHERAKLHLQMAELATKKAMGAVGTPASLGEAAGLPPSVAPDVMTGFGGQSAGGGSNGQ